MQASVGMVSIETCPHSGHVNWHVVVGMPVETLTVQPCLAEAGRGVDEPRARKLRYRGAGTVSSAARAMDALGGEASAGSRRSSSL